MNATTSTQVKKPSKLAMGLLAAGVTALVAVTGTGVAQAAPTDKPTRDSCKNSGYTNYGQCVRDWANKRGGGGGYGGQQNVDIDVGVIGNGNIVNVIINILFG